MLARITVTIPQAPGNGRAVSYHHTLAWYVPVVINSRVLPLLGMLVLLAACDHTAGTAPSIRLDAGNAKLLATGQAVYAKHCASCHGAQLQGQPNWRERDATGRLPAPPHDASGHTWHHPDRVLFDITKYGVAKAANLKDYQSAMPVYEGVLTDAEIVAVLSWIKSRWPAGVRDKQEQVNAAAERNAAANR
jgi:S-disulfanyl-L-cysteine oxidoreductase SoxD